MKLPRWSVLLIGSVLLAALAACGETARTLATKDGNAGHDGHAMPDPNAQPSPGSTVASTNMDAEHEAGVKAFPAKTSGIGDRVLRPTISGAVKTFDITASAVRWEVTPGSFVDGFAYNGQIPGPQIRVRRGDRIRVVVHNRLPESTAVHFHGVEVPNAMDGVPFITQPPIKSGETFTYEFVVREPPGSYMYHSHFNATEQVGKGLLGAFIVEGRRAWEVEQNIILGDGELGFTLNGKGFPATAPISAKIGQRVLIRFMNAGQQLHPMHLHGVHFTVIARDGRPVPSAYEADTITVAPGERWDVILNARLPGVWALHCHILPHVESSHGMFGMVTAVIIG